MVPLILLIWTSGDVCLGFQSQGGSLACMPCHLHAMDSSNSPLVRHLLTSWWPAITDLNFINFIENYTQKFVINGKDTIIILLVIDKDN